MHTMYVQYIKGKAAFITSHFQVSRCLHKCCPTCILRGKQELDIHEIIGMPGKMAHFYGTLHAAMLWMKHYGLEFCVSLILGCIGGALLAVR